MTRAEAPWTAQVAESSDNSIDEPGMMAADREGTAPQRELDAVSGLFRSHANRVYGYVRLRTTPEMADDVVADTFLTAWRLRDRIPDDPLPWLLVIARNALANRNRAAGRSTRLIVAMAAVERVAGHHPAAEETVVAREQVLAAIALLTDDEREALLLVAWDGLAQADAAAVAGCSERTFARRLRRARHHLTDEAATAVQPLPNIDPTEESS